ncbi:MAG: sensor histidine kinase [Vicinamibacterales bacterium]
MTSLRPQSFRARLTWRWTVAVGLLLALANAAIYAGASIYLRRWLDEHVRTVAATEAASSTDGPSDVHLHESPYAQLQREGFTEKVVQIFDARGALVLQSTALEGAPPLVAPEVVARGLAGDAPMVDATLSGRRVRLNVLAAARGPRRYAVAVGLYADDVDRGLRALAWLLAAVWTAGICGTAVLGYRLASRALAPVSRITERAAWIAQGNFDARLDGPEVLDEVGRMTVLLNSMLDRLQRSVDANRRFAADASHELRSPLTAMAGELDVALRHPRSADSYRETLTYLRARVAALTELAGDLMLLARVEEGDDVARHEVPLAPLVDEAFARWTPAAEARRIQLSHEGLAHVTVYADRALVTRVVDNVVANAVHYNRDGGSVRVTARVDAPADDAWAPTLVTIEVRDEGPGIPADQHERVFERFFRLDESRRRHTGGTGLGLAICREVARVLGGSIRVAGSSAAGTTIAITLPGHGPAAPVAPADGRAGDLAAPGSAPLPSRPGA